jgi:hypothetical protein
MPSLPPAKTSDSTLQFIAIELAAFFFQVLVIFVVTFFISDMFDNSARLNEFLSGKINTNTMKEFFLTLFAVTFCFGLVAIAKEISSNQFVSAIADEVLNEIPRTIYVFGSTITAVALSAAIVSAGHAPAGSKANIGFGLAAFFATVFFTYGCGAKALLAAKRKKTAKKI